MTSRRRMTSAEVDLYGRRLLTARTISGLLAKDLANLLGVSGTQLSRWENNFSSSVPEGHVRTLSEQTGFGESFFSSPPVADVDVSSMAFRASARMTKHSKLVLDMWREMIDEVIIAINERVVLMPLQVTSAPSPPANADHTVYALHAAQALRENLRLAPDEPIHDLLLTLEKAGVLSACLDFDDNLHLKRHDAFSYWHTISGSARPVIVLRASSSWERTRLSVAHELGHIVLHRFSSPATMEAEAFAFGAEFLFPSATLAAQWPARATLSSLEPLKHRWGMSIAALIEHGHNHHLLSDARRVSLYKQLSRVNPRTGVRWRQQEPGWDARTPERPVAIADTLTVAFDTNNPSEIAHDLSQTIQQWRPDMIHRLLAGFDTPWSRQIKDNLQRETLKTIVEHSDPREGGAVVVDLFSRRPTAKTDNLVRQAQE